MADAFKVIKPETKGRIHMNMIIYGLTGVGKTEFCGTADESPFTKPALLVDIDGGILTLAGRDVDVTRPKSFKDLQAIYDFLLNDNTKYKSVCIDSLTEIQRKLSMGEIMEDLDEKASYSNLGKSNPPDRRDWLRSHEHMRKFIRAFRDLCYLDDFKRRVHVVFTTLEKNDESRQIVCPNLPGLLGLECGAFVDVLARLSVEMRIKKTKGEDAGNGEKEEARFLLVRNFTDDDGIKYLGKNRGGKLGKGLWNPNVGKLVSKWMGEDPSQEEKKK